MSLKKEIIYSEGPIEHPESVIKQEIEELNKLKEELEEKRKTHVVKTLKVTPKRKVGRPKKGDNTSTIMVRKKRKDSDELEEMPIAVKYAIIEDFLSASLTNQQLADKYQTTKVAVDHIIDRHYKSLKNIKETRFLLTNNPNSTRPMNQQSSKTINTIYKILFTDGSTTEEFLERISSDEDLTLTNWEAAFCYNYIYSTNEIDALEKSGLTVGLIKAEEAGGEKRNNYDKACRLRSTYLRRKPNIAKEIRRIQDSYLKDIGITKEYIQSEYIREIEELREDKDLKARQLLSRNLELLGKTIPGTFSERIEVSEINPAKALDKLLDMARANVRELPSGSHTDETWELGDNINE